MGLTQIEVKLKNIAFLLGVLQGLTYALMALICIISYNKDEISFKFDSGYMRLVQHNMYHIFLSPMDKVHFDYSLKPKVFTGFACIYFFLHLGWFVVSFEASCKRGVTLPKYLTAWSYFTLLISAWDFITVVILGSDYHKCLDWAADRAADSVAHCSNKYSAIDIDMRTNTLVRAQEPCLTGVLPVLVIAARGFVLWIVNVILAVALLEMAKDLKAGQVFPQPVAAPPLVLPTQHVPVNPEPNVSATSPQPTEYPVRYILFGSGGQFWTRTNRPTSISDGSHQTY